MSQERLIKLQCKECKQIGYFSFKSKGAAKEKLEISKFCKFCRKHTPHKEAK
jgi:large subunit ribosomal protein L33